jgi:hypothetical protein
MRCNVVKNLLSMIVLVFPLVSTAAPKVHDNVGEPMGLKSVFVHNSNVASEAIQSLNNMQALTADEDEMADNNSAPADAPIVEQV